jgi:hypothetical protein
MKYLILISLLIMITKALENIQAAPVEDRKGFIDVLKRNQIGDDVVRVKRNIGRKSFNTQ